MSVENGKLYRQNASTRPCGSRLSLSTLHWHKRWQQNSASSSSILSKPVVDTGSGSTLLVSIMWERVSFHLIHPFETRCLTRAQFLLCWLLPCGSNTQLPARPSFRNQWLTRAQVLFCWFLSCENDSTSSILWNPVPDTGSDSILLASIMWKQFSFPAIFAISTKPSNCFTWLQDAVVAPA